MRPGAVLLEDGGTAVRDQASDSLLAERLCGSRSVSTAAAPYLTVIAEYGAAGV